MSNARVRHRRQRRLAKAEAKRARFVAAWKAVGVHIAQVMATPRRYPLGFVPTQQR
jgi:hypothetical protein